ncbi:hypothetical protein V6N13_091672 [Hibiscus sabdariffa]
MLEDLEWSYLKEIFSAIRPWLESLSRRERATWLEFSGLSLHCWNVVTLERLAELWGTFDALGINAKHTRDCEKVTVLISTNQVQNIEEVVELELEDKIFEVGVVELGFTDDSSSIGKEESENNAYGEHVQESESVTDTNLEQEKNVF